MKKGSIGKVVDWTFYNPETGDIMANAWYNVTTGLEISANETLGRAGQDGALLGILYDSPDATMTFEDFTWDLDLIALSFGSAIEMDADIQKLEPFTVVTANTIEVTETPVKFNDAVGVIGWYKKANETEFKTFAFDEGANTATISDLAIGDEVCIKYIRTAIGSREIQINTEMLPPIMHAVGTTPILNVAVAGTDMASANRVGTAIIEGEKLMLTPSLSMSGGQSQYSTNAKTGRFLQTTPMGCSSKPYLLKLKEEYFNADEFDGVTGLLVVNGVVELEAGSAVTPQIQRWYNNMTLPKKVVDYTKLTYVSNDTGVATVVNGTITAVATGETDIEVIVTDKPNINTVIRVEVTA